MRSDRQAFNGPPVFCFQHSNSKSTVENYVQNVESKIRPSPTIAIREGLAYFAYSRFTLNFSLNFCKSRE